jgi:hypothetical protein
LKKVIAIHFLLIYLFSATEFKQLLKLPTVFEHFSEHQLEDNQISFVHFLAIHYLHGSPKDQDYKKDMQLPFKTSSDSCSNFANEIAVSSLQFTILHPLLIIEKKQPLLQNNDTFSSFLSKIWQPPKFC